MNAYAGSLAWSNFFSRLTHSHPGRVIWLVFNVAIALLLMELGIYRLLEETLGIFSIIAMAWLCTISADLFINKPLGLAPPGIEFKRAHLYDINPAGLGAMALSATIALIAHFGAFGTIAASLAPYITLASCAHRLAHDRMGDQGQILSRPQTPPKLEEPRHHHLLGLRTSIRAGGHGAGARPMPRRSAHSAARWTAAATTCASRRRGSTRRWAPSLKTLLPETIVAKLATRLGRYGIAVAVALTAVGAILAMIAHQVGSASPETAVVVDRTILIVFFVFAVIAGVVCWFYVLAHDSRVVAEEESSRQNTLLLKEIAAHKKTDAALQTAKEAAEAANRAESRYVVGLSHELRTPLNAVLGYAQILERDETIPAPRQSSLKVIRRSAEHLFRTD